VLVLFDGDAAGQAATGPAVEKLLAAGLLPIVGVLGGAGESAVDPAEVLVQHGVEELRRRVEASPQPVVDYVVTGAADDGGDRGADVGAASGAPGFRPVRLGAADDVFAKALRAAERIALSPEPLVRGVLAREVGLALGMPFEAILAQVYRVRASAVERGPQEASQGGD
jgi:DNA primase